MKGINKAIIVGTLGDDPTQAAMPNGTSVTKLSVATNESWKDKQSGEQKERTEWHRVVMFGRLAEIAGEYLKKGSQVYLEGKIKTSKYEKDGSTRYSTEIVAHEMQMLGGKGESARPTDSGSPHSRQRSDVPDDDFGDQSIPF